MTHDPTPHPAARPGASTPGTKSPAATGGDNAEERAREVLAELAAELGGDSRVRIIIRHAERKLAGSPQPAPRPRAAGASTSGAESPASSTPVAAEARAHGVLVDLACELADSPRVREIIADAAQKLAPRPARPRPDTRPAGCVDCGARRDPDREAAGKWRCGFCAASVAGDLPGKPPTPALVTWCASCGRAGMRKPGETLDETCRFCTTGEVRVKRFPDRRQARAHAAKLQAKRARAQAARGTA